MPSLNDLVRDRTALGEPDVEWLRQLVGDWQLLSDLSFADLVLWVAATDGGWLAVAHVRPTTGSTVFFDDVVGTEVQRGRRAQLDRAFDLGLICRERDPEWTEDVPVREETIPVLRAGRTIAVLSRHTDLSSLRTPSRLEVTYMACADALALMVSEGAFPVAGAPTGSRRGAPRVGDGLIRVDVDGVVVYASPNAVSAFHRLGHGRELIGQSLAEVTTPLVRSQGVVDEGLPLVLTGRAPWRCDLDGAGGTTLSLRAIPLQREGERIGALLLLRDVTELRRRERELLSKDAMIREIHHRVKNNLQTVAALLRLQARRLDGGPARAALDEAVRRVGAIALVHETLSAGYDETVDFDEVAVRGLATVVEVASRSGSVRAQHGGKFGRLRAEDATALSLVLTELVQNAVEHGFDGRDGVVSVTADRRHEGEAGADRLDVLVSDDGTGLPDGRTVPSGGLGTQIVRSLVGELRGTIEWRPREGGGTEVHLRLRPRGLK